MLFNIIYSGYFSSKDLYCLSYFIPIIVSWMLTSYCNPNRRWLHSCSFEPQRLKKTICLRVKVIFYFERKPSLCVCSLWYTQTLFPSRVHICFSVSVLWPLSFVHFVGLTIFWTSSRTPLLELLDLSSALTWYFLPLHFYLHFFPKIKFYSFAL